MTRMNERRATNSEKNLSHRLPPLQDGVFALFALMVTGEHTGWRVGGRVGISSHTTSHVRRYKRKTLAKAGVRKGASVSGVVRTDEGGRGREE